MADLEQEIEAIEKTMAADSDAYFRDERMQARYAELLGAQESGGPAPAGPSRNADRMRAIEAEMAAPMNHSRYWANTPEGERMRQEYAALLSGPPQSAYDAVAEAHRDVGEPTVADVLGLDAEGVTELQERVAQAFEGVDTGDLDSAFDGLSDRAQFGIYKLLADPSAVLRDQSTVDAFAGEIGDAAFQEILFFEASMTEPEKAALRRAVFLD